MSASGAVPVRRAAYPQVDPRAAGLMRRAVALAPRNATLAEAARLVERARARVVASRMGRRWGAAARHTVTRALALGLGEAPLTTVLEESVVVPPATAEVAVRRRLGPDRPFALVLGPSGPVGVVFRDPAAPGPLPLDLTRRLQELPAPLAELLRAAGAVGDALTLPVAVVGGLVRDLLLGRAHEGTDVDLVVEGSAGAVARGLARHRAGRVTEHAAFLTASVTLSDGRRLDLATARRESYRAPGALPSVEPASLEEDLARRDFAVNALAVRLDRARWGRLVDTTGGLADVRARRIRVLHPLSFVEDPTRIFRAARLATRLGCRIDPGTRGLAARSATLDVYAALSGDRLRAELDLLLAEPRPATALREAGRLGAWDLVERGAGRRGQSTPLLSRVLSPRALDGLAPDTAVALALLALTGGSAAVRVWAGRISLAPSAQEAIRRARQDAPRLLARLGRVRGRGAAYAMLQEVPEATLAWARALATPPARRYLDAQLRTWRRLRPLATGDDVTALGVDPGPAVGDLLRALRAAQAAGAIRTRAGALRWLTDAVIRSHEHRNRIAHPTG